MHYLETTQISTAEAEPLFPARDYTYSRHLLYLPHYGGFEVSSGDGLQADYYRLPESRADQVWLALVLLAQLTHEGAPLVISRAGLRRALGYRIEPVLDALREWITWEPVPGGTRISFVGGVPDPPQPDAVSLTRYALRAYTPGREWIVKN